MWQEILIHTHTGLAEQVGLTKPPKVHTISSIVYMMKGVVLFYNLYLTFVFHEHGFVILPVVGFEAGL
jgi:hypothetical protein